MVIVQPLVCEWALCGGTNEIGTGPQLFAAMDWDAPVFAQQLCLCEGVKGQTGLLQKVFSFVVSKERFHN